MKQGVSESLPTLDDYDENEIMESPDFNWDKYFSRESSVELDVPFSEESDDE